MYMKECTIKYKIIHIENIVEIARFFEGVAKSEIGKCTFEIAFRDGTKETIHDSDYFMSPNFKYRDTAYIRFLFKNYSQEKKVTLHLQESILFSEINNYEIISDEGIWLENIQSELDRMMKGMGELPFIRKTFAFPWLFIWLLILFGVGCIVMQMLGFVYGQKPSLTDVPPNTSVLFVPFRTFAFSIILLFLIVTASVTALYPEQEFAFGVKRHKYRVKIRKAIWWIITTIIIPVAISCMLK